MGGGAAQRREGFAVLGRPRAVVLLVRGTRVCERAHRLRWARMLLFTFIGALERRLLWRFKEKVVWSSCSTALREGFILRT